MDFCLTAEQRERQRRILEFAREVLSPGAREREAERRFSRELFERAGAEGLAGLPIAVEHGGLGLGALDTILALEALGSGCEDGGLVFALAAHTLACTVPVWQSGTEDQQRRHLRDLARGRRIAANAITETAAGSDAFALRTTARRDGDGYVLDGEKRHVTNAPVADLFVVYAKTDPGESWFGTSCFLVERDAPGLHVAPEGPKWGLTTTPWGSVRFEGVRVAASARLGPEGAGAAIFHESMAWERGCLFAMYVGAMERTLERALEHARTREQFGQPIGRNQSVSNKLVDMKLRLETSRLLLYRTGWLLDRDGRAEEAVAMSKLWIAESAVASGLDAVQVLGAAGMTLDSGVGALLRDALPARIFSGTSELQRETLARLLGLR